MDAGSPKRKIVFHKPVTFHDWRTNMLDTRGQKKLPQHLGEGERADSFLHESCIRNPIGRIPKRVLNMSYHALLISPFEIGDDVLNTLWITCIAGWCLKTSKLAHLLHVVVNKQLVPLKRPTLDTECWPQHKAWHGSTKLRTIRFVLGML